MNTKSVNTAAGVILAALTQNRTAAGIALALDSAQLLLTPEVVAELERIPGLEATASRVVRAEKRRAELEAVLATHRRDDHAEIERLKTRIAGLEATVRAMAAVDAVQATNRSMRASVDQLTRTFAPTQALREPEGEFHSFLHHEHRTPHDRPETGGAR
ncbi:hypothetical protein [Streptomyces sp. NPDC051016]|uniref:hypothetical protein n=1 Tax=Streptomyces sp. NPDC051016 TaxID=3365638 RepID=UPI0037BDE045